MNVCDVLRVWWVVVIVYVRKNPALGPWKERGGVGSVVLGTVVRTDFWIDHPVATPFATDANFFI